MKYLTPRIAMTSLAASLLFIGAGCPGTGANDIAVPATGANGESDLVSTKGVAVGLQEQAARQQDDQYNAQQQAPAHDDAAMMDDAGAMAGDGAMADKMDDGAMAQKPPVPKAFPGVLPASRINNKLVTIATAKGDIVFEVLDGEGPKAASNFIALAESGFYDGLIFHRVESWVIQGGDPTGTGRGGPGYQFEDEPVNLPYKEGIVAMANAGPDTNGSQFFILTKDTPLQPDYTIFGRVVSGLDVVHKIAVGDKMTSVTVSDK